MTRDSVRDRRAPSQFDFWSLNPCGTEGSLASKMRQRYRMEPWIPLEIERFPATEVKVLEVGCGQGVDAFNICARLDPSSRYIAIDYSEESIRRCKESIGEAKNMFPLPVIPEFRKADALSLPFDDGEFDFVYSLGVLHHTPDAERGIDEIYRVLRDGGGCVVVLYRFPSLKVGVAKMLRSVQKLLEWATGSELPVYNFLRKRGHFRGSLGTMLLECFGVPWMSWFGKKDVERMFAKYQVRNIEPYGFNFPRWRKTTSGRNSFGYFFKIEATKHNLSKQ